jgi:hypothetical protein
VSKGKLPTNTVDSVAVEGGKDSLVVIKGLGNQESGCFLTSGVSDRSPPQKGADKEYKLTKPNQKRFGKYSVNSLNLECARSMQIPIAHK